MPERIFTNGGRKIIVSMNITLDGFISGPDCELDWHFKNWASDMAEALCRQLRKADTLLFGRVTYEAMAAYWGSKAMDISLPEDDREFIALMNSHSKIVVSGTLIRLPWKNTSILSGSLETEIKDLKAAGGKDIIIYGSGRLVSSIIRLGLADEFQLWVHPVALGRGKPLFHFERQLRLKETRTFSSGVVLLSYTV